MSRFERDVRVVSWRVPCLVAALAAAGPAEARGQGWSASATGNLFGGYTAQTTARGSSRPDVSGWSTGTLSWTAGRLTTGLHLMATPDPLAPGECGHPRLLTGTQGMCGAVTSADRGHPHPLIMDLGLSAAARIGSVTASLRGGPAGEPALGPPSYMHRPSAGFDPLVPLTSLETNPAHTANGLVTMSLTRDVAILEGSWFSSDPGDEDPWDLDASRPDSWSARLRLDVAATTRIQVSAGALDPPAHGSHAGHEPGGRLRIWSASVQHERRAGALALASTAAWTRSRNGGRDTDALLAELLGVRNAHALFLRAELLERIAIEHRFGEIAPDGSHDHFLIEHLTTATELGAGYSARVLSRRGVDLRAGLRGAVTFIPELGRDSYGAPRARTIAVFAQLSPRSSSHHH